MQSCAICLIVKDENPEVAEWVAHYYNLGADRLIVYDNASNDGTSSLLRDLTRNFPITLIDWKETTQQQQKAYAHCLAAFGDQFDWIGFIDADEFLIPPSGDDLQALLARHVEHQAIGLFWLIFGSNDIVDLNGNTVMESFTRCSDARFSVNRHVKSLVRPRACTGLHNVHRFQGVEYYDVTGQHLTEWETSGTVRASTPIPESWRLHHYVLRSEAHIAKRKSRVGSATRKDSRPESFYRLHDRNEVLNEAAVPYGRAARALLLKHGFDLFPSRIPPTLRQEESVARCPLVHLDTLAFGQATGWVQDLNGAPISDTLQIHVDGVHMLDVVPSLFRSDVEKAGYPGRSGFSFVPPPRLVLGSGGTLSMTTALGDWLPIAFRGGEARDTLAYSPLMGVSVAGSIDGFHGADLHGWAFARPHDACGCELPWLVLTRDDEVIAEFQPNLPRPDVRESLPDAPLNCGFVVRVPALFHRVEPSEFRVALKSQPDCAIGAPLRHGFGAGAGSAASAAQVVGHIDGFKGATLQGWLFLRHPDGATQGELPIEIWQDDELIGEMRADGARNDVLGEHPQAPARCGFKFTVQEAHRKIKLSVYRIAVKGVAACEIPGNDLRHSFAPVLDPALPRDWFLSDYPAWIRLKDADLKQRAAKMDVAGAGRVSIVCPVYKPDPLDLMAAINSVLAQTYADWELLLVNDGSRSPALSAFLAGYEMVDERIKIIQCAANRGIAAATNRGLEEAQGAFVAFLDQDDVLSPCALTVMLHEALRTGAELLYSDEDKLQREHRFDPMFKPDWNWRYLLGANYICHFVMASAALVKRVGLLDPELDGAQDHDFLLRASELLADGQIRHVPEILYSWRISAGSTAGGSEAKPHAAAAGVRAVEAHLARKLLPAAVTSRNNKTWYSVRWAFAHEPTVRIVVPFKEAVDMTRECLNRVLGLTDYRNYEVVLVDNASSSGAAARFRNEAARTPRVRVLKIDEPFNYSRLNNRAAALEPAPGFAAPEFLLLLNNDVFVRTSDWLRLMVDEMLADPEVGVVGAKLLYGDGVVQHAGVVAGLGGVAGHVCNMRSAETEGYMGRAVLPHQVCMVTGACMLIDAAAFAHVGGLTEALPVAFNDVDFCLKIARDAGLKTIIDTEVVADHMESATRGPDDMDPVKYARFVEAFDYMQEHWSEWLDRDPYYHPNFSLKDGTTFERLKDPTHPHDRSDRPKATAKPRYLRLAS